MADQLIAYYARRAQEYDQIYQKPERQEELGQLADWLRQEVAGKRVLEVACGTGYWTQVMAETAASVVATDINPEMLEVAEAKCQGLLNVRFEQADVYNLEISAGAFDFVFGGFIWSHIPQDRLVDFLSTLHAQLGRGGRLLFLDNTFVEGESTPIARTDRAGNTYQKRQLTDGSEYLILKNFPGKKVIRSLLASQAHDFQFLKLPHYWRLSYTLAL